MDLSSLDLQTMGAVASIAGLLPSFIQWFTSEYRAMRGKKKEEASDVIQQYIEWLHRQRHEKILEKLSASQEAIGELSILLEELMEKSEQEIKAVLERLGEMNSGFHEKLDTLIHLFNEPVDSTGKEHEFENEYLGHVKQEFERLRVLGVSEMRQIRQELSIAYVSLNLKSTPKPTKVESAEGEEEDIEDSESRSSEDVLRDNPLMTIRGPAGSGKTTLMRWLALQCSMTDVEEEENPWRNGIPFHIPLRSLESKDQGKPKFERFLSYTIDPDVWSKKPPEGWIERVLKQGRALVLIDGIDELPPHLRPKFWTWLEKFVRHQPGNRVYVTSRPFPEREDDIIGPLWNPPIEFVPAELDEMNDQDIKVFINNWHNAVIMHEEDEQERIELQRARDRLPQRLTEPRNRSVRELCRTPLLCALVCAMHWREEGYLPASRIDLYDSCCTMLIELRDVKKDLPPIDGPLGNLTLKDKEMILRRLALEMMRNKTRAGTRQQIEISRGDCIKWVSLSIPSCASDEARKCQPEELINYLIERSGLLREPAKGRVDFPHRTFQEYLAACAAGEANDAGDLASRVGQDQWRETILLAAGTKIGGAPFGNALIKELVERGEQEKKNKSLRHAYFALAVGCLETGGPTIATNLRDQVLKHLKEITPPQSFEEARILFAAGEVVLEYLSYSNLKGQNKMVKVVAACARTLSLIGSEKAVKMLEDPIGYGKDRRVTVQAEICKCPSVDISNICYIWSVQRICSRWNGPSQMIAPLIKKIPLKMLTPYNIVNLTGCSALTELSLSSLDSVKILILKYCTGLMRLASDDLPKNLEELNLAGCTGITSLALAELPKLSKLNLSTCRALRSRANTDLPKNLEELNLAGCTGITSLALAELPKLSKLNLSMCIALKSLDAADLPKNLEDLNLARCTGITSLALADLPMLSKLNLSTCRVANHDLPKNLEELNLAGCTGITSLALAELPNLSKLNLSTCSALKSLEAADLPKNLEELNLARCTSITSFALADLPKLSKLDLSWCSDLKSLDASDLPKNLKELDLSMYTGITSLALADLPKLSKLDLSMCIALKSLANTDLPKNLEELNLSGCTDITSLALADLPKLSKLALNWCRALNDLFLQNLPKNLEELNLAGCKGITSLAHVCQLRS